jgi:hypothetical protein
VAASSPEPTELEPARLAPLPAPEPAPVEPVPVPRPARSPFAALWPVAAALIAGCVAAGLLLSLSLRVEFPLFSEASAERGRDCIAITSARHALDATLQARLPVRAPDAGAARAIRSAVTAFDARTQDIATPAVESALNPVRGALDTLSDSVQAYAAAPVGPPSGAAGEAVQDALARVDESWQGAIARVCS